MCEGVSGAAIVSCDFSAVLSEGELETPLSIQYRLFAFCLCSVESTDDSYFLCIQKVFIYFLCGGNISSCCCTRWRKAISIGVVWRRSGALWCLAKRVFVVAKPFYDYKLSRL